MAATLCSSAPAFLGVVIFPDQQALTAAAYYDGKCQLLTLEDGTVATLERVSQMGRGRRSWNTLGPVPPSV